MLFCDVVGSTGLGEALDPEALQGVLGRYFEEVRAAVERHGGTVEKFIGDAVVAVFGIPVVREDDALRAVRAAVEIRERLPAVAEEVGLALTFRTGVNTGVVLAGGGENLALGDAVNVAARLEQAAPPGGILVGEETFRLVRDAVQVEPLEPLVLKGKSSPVSAFRLLAVDPLAPGLARHFHMSLIGRERELGLLRQVSDRTIEEADCRLLTLLGVAGVGKSRLVAELFGQVGEDATVLSGRCLPYGEGITFWPLLEALSSVGEPALEVLDRLSGGSAAVPEELFFEVRRLLESLALKRPVILHIDDLQWGEPMLLDLLDHIVTLSRGAPVLILCSARPELLERRPAWGGGKVDATTVRLEPLQPGDCELLLDQLGDGLSPDTRARVISASEGNPLFLEEMAALGPEGDSFAVPSTIQALLTARLERLPTEERELLERAAIEGEVFHLASVRALSTDHSDSELELRLAAVVRKELIRPHPPTFHGDRAFRFRHLLIRDAAYDAIPKALRATLHDRFADWLERNAQELAELDEIAGWHLEQTIHYHQELRRSANRSLLRRAAEHLYSAGRRAGDRGDPAAARNLLDRALALAADDAQLNAQVAVDLVEQLIEAGDLARADALLSVLEAEPEFSGLAAITRLQWLIRAQPEVAKQAVDAALPGLIEQFARAGDQRGLANAHMLAFDVSRYDSAFKLAAEQLRLAADYARNAGDGGLRSRALGWYVLALMRGPADATAMRDELDAIESEESTPYLAAWIAVGRAELARLAGSFDDARHSARHAIELFQAMGINVLAAACHQLLTEVELSAEEPGRALSGLLEADASLAAMGDHGIRSTIQALLAQVYERIGDRVSARAAIELTEELGGEEDRINFVITHGVRARLALADEDGDAAVGWARSASEYASRTEMPLARSDAEVELARVLSAIGRSQEAISHARTALEMAEAKGDRPRAADAQALFDQLHVRV